jgi:hypothetical protein
MKSCWTIRDQVHVRNFISDPIVLKLLDLFDNTFNKVEGHARVVLSNRDLKETFKRDACSFGLLFRHGFGIGSRGRGTACGSTTCVGPEIQKISGKHCAQ